MVPHDVATISRNVIKRFIDPAPLEFTGPTGEYRADGLPPHLKCDWRKGV